MRQSVYTQQLLATPIYPVGCSLRTQHPGRASPTRLHRAFSDLWHRPSEAKAVRTHVTATLTRNALLYHTHSCRCWTGSVYKNKKIENPGVVVLDGAVSINSIYPTTSRKILIFANLCPLPSIYSGYTVIGSGCPALPRRADPWLLSTGVKQYVPLLALQRYQHGVTHTLYSLNRRFWQ